MGIEPAGEARERAAQRVGELLGGAGGDADAARGDLAHMDGEEGPADAALRQVAHEHEHQRGDEQDDLEIGGGVDPHPKDREGVQRGGGNPGEAHGAAGDVVPLPHDLVEDHAEAERHHGEIDVAHPARGEGEQPPGRGREQRGERDGEGDVHAMRLGQDAGAVGADAEEAGMAERDLPREAGQQVDALGEDDRDQREGQDLHRAGAEPAAAEEQRQHQREMEGRMGDRAAQRAAQAAHALLTSGRPSRPCGLSASMAMSRAKAMACSAAVEM